VQKGKHGFVLLTQCLLLIAYFVYSLLSLALAAASRAYVFVINIRRAISGSADAPRATVRGSRENSRHCLKSQLKMSN